MRIMANGFLPVFGILFLSLMGMQSINAQTTYKEKNRPQIHFSPKAHWVNDPNGMVYYKGVYHLFFQYYPEATVWGPMHWGHATSTDLVHWEEKPIALYPDSLGYIFSGSAVVDIHNTTGLGKNGVVPLIALFTSHDPLGEKSGKVDFQNQSLAYSLDEGNTWIKYSGNPVLKNPGIRDFRDPKVYWYDREKKWIMTLATMDRITFYSAPDLIHWKKESEFGQYLGHHEGVWECPDLFPIRYHGKDIWVLLVNYNPGGPNKGSATQYFLGDFNGKEFKPFRPESKWFDYGPDEYAGITWSNTPGRHIFLGWMSNWLYANQVSTDKWRNAMTLPRELGLEEHKGDYFLSSRPVKELDPLETSSQELASKVVSGGYILPLPIGSGIPCRLDMELGEATDFSFEVSNGIGETIRIGFDKTRKEFFFDRRNSGQVDFQKDFPSISTMKRILPSGAMDFTLILDQSSMELFSDHGLNAMTGIFFPNQPYNQVKLVLKNTKAIKKLRYASLKGIWE